MRSSQNTSSRSNKLFITHGLSTFTNNNDYKNVQKLFTPWIIKQLQQNYLQINPDQYFLKQWNVIFSLMTKTQIVTLQIDNLANSSKKHLALNYSIEILLSFSKIQFSKLNRLNLYRCDIVSIQALSWMNFPQIKYINLTYNFINSYNSLTKCQFQINDLYVYSEKKLSPNVQKLQRAKSKFNCVGFQFNAKSSIISQDLSFIAKFNFHKTFYQRKQKTIKIGKKKRIQQPKVKKVLENFCNKVNFYINQSQNNQTNRGQREMRMEQRRPPSFMEMFATSMGWGDIADTVHYYREIFDSGNPNGFYDQDFQSDDEYYYDNW